MRRRLWRVCKKLFPVITFLWIANWVLNLLENFWTTLIFHRFPLSANEWRGWIMTSAASLFLTVATLLITDYILEIHWTKRLLNKLAKRSAILGYFWSDDEVAGTPVMFQYPTEGRWKLGFHMGEQKVVDGDGNTIICDRIFFVTGVGDHVLINRQRPGLIKKLSNPVPEVAKLIASFMTSGPEYLKQKSENKTEEKT